MARNETKNKKRPPFSSLLLSFQRMALDVLSQEETTPPSREGKGEEEEEEEEETHGWRRTYAEQLGRAQRQLRSLIAFPQMPTEATPTRLLSASASSCTALHRNVHGTEGEGRPSPFAGGQQVLEWYEKALQQMFLVLADTSAASTAADPPPISTASTFPSAVDLTPLPTTSRRMEEETSEVEASLEALHVVLKEAVLQQWMQVCKEEDAFIPSLPVLHHPHDADQVLPTDLSPWTKVWVALLSLSRTPAALGSHHHIDPVCAIQEVPSGGGLSPSFHDGPRRPNPVLEKEEAEENVWISLPEPTSAMGARVLCVEVQEWVRERKGARAAWCSSSSSSSPRVGMSRERQERNETPRDEKKEAVVEAESEVPLHHDHTAWPFPVFSPLSLPPIWPGDTFVSPEDIPTVFPFPSPMGTRERTVGTTTAAAIPKASPVENPFMRCSTSSFETSMASVWSSTVVGWCRAFLSSLAQVVREWDQHVMDRAQQSIYHTVGRQRKTMREGSAAKVNECVILERPPQTEREEEEGEMFLSDASEWCHTTLVGTTCFVWYVLEALPWVLLHHLVFCMHLWKEKENANRT